VQTFFVRDGEHGSESFQIDVPLTNFMMRRQSQVSRGDDRLLGTLVSDLE